MRVTASCPSARRLAAQYERAPEIVAPLLRQAAEAAGQTTVEATRARAHPSFAPHITYRLAGTGADLRAQVVMDTKAKPHAVFYARGTPPHAIRARFQKRLRFEVGGSVVFTPEVWHPGTLPHPFMREGLQDARPTLIRIYAAYLGLANQRIQRTAGE